MVIGAAQEGNELITETYVRRSYSAVDDLDKACKRFTDLGVKFKKRPEDGKMRNIAFM